MPWRRNLGAFLLFFLLACSPEPEPILYGQDACDYCRMVIVDARFGAELVTRKGKILKFDASECLAAFCLEKRLESKDIRSLWVTDFNRPKAFLEAEQAHYLRAERLQSPMGLGLLAFKTKEDALESQGRYGGEPLGWREVLSLVKSEWLELGKHAAHKAR